MWHQKGKISVMANPMMYTVILGSFFLSSSLGSAQSLPSTQPSQQEASFEAIYRLKNGELAKLVQRPFLQERKDYFPSPALRDKGQIIFDWDAETLHAYSESGGDGTIASALGSAGLMHWEIEADGFKDERSLKYISLPGDWIVRKSADRERLLEAIKNIIARSHPEIRIEKRDVDREIIIAEGKFDYAKHPSIYITMSDRESPNGGGSGTIGVFLRRLSDMTHHEVIDHTETLLLLPDRFSWGEDGSLSTEDYRLKDLLAEVSKKTGLSFRLGRKLQTVYFITKN